MNSKKINRTSEDVKRILNDVIRNKMRDPRLGEHVIITDVNLSEDLNHAKVLVSCIGTEKETEKIVEILNSAKGFIRTSLSKKLSVRTTPTLTFFVDDGITKIMKIEKILNDLNRNEED